MCLQIADVSLIKSFQAFESRGAIEPLQRQLELALARALEAEKNTAHKEAENAHLQKYFEAFQEQTQQKVFSCTILNTRV